MDSALDEWPIFMDVDHEEEVYTTDSEVEPKRCQRRGRERAPERGRKHRAKNRTRSELRDESMPRLEAYSYIEPHYSDAEPMQEETDGSEMPDLGEPMVTLAADEMAEETNVILSAPSSPTSSNPEVELFDSPTAWVLEVGPFFDYLVEVAGSGKSSMPWEEVQPAFLDYFKDAFYTLENYFYKFNRESSDMSECSENMRIYRFICLKIEKFDNFPFTFRRLCELLVEPTRYYTKFPKLMRALEKVIDVVSTVSLCSHSNATKPVEEQSKIESFFYRKANDYHDRLNSSIYGPNEKKEDEEVEDSSKSNWDSDESRYCKSDSDDSATSDVHSKSCGDAIVSHGDSFALRKAPALQRQRGGSDKAFARSSADDSGLEYDADRDESYVDRVARRRREKRKGCRKRDRNTHSLLREFAECTIAKKPLIDDKSAEGGDIKPSPAQSDEQNDQNQNNRVTIVPVLSFEDMPGPSSSHQIRRKVLANPNGNYELYEVVSEDTIRREIAKGRKYNICEVREVYDDEIGSETYEIIDEHSELPVDSDHARAFLDETKD